MLLTAAEVGTWIGRAAMDPYGEPLGEVKALLSDAHSGAPEWLLLADPGAHEGRLVPVAGSVPTGRQVRVVPTAARIGTAPSLRVGEDIGAGEKEQAAAHYGLRLDRESSPSGILSAPQQDGRGDGPREAPSAQSLSAIADGLRAAHAMEQASLKLLDAMRRRDRDEELVHDIALHHTATHDHAERIRVRLDELEASRARPLDWLAKVGAYLEAQRGRLRRVPEPADLEEALRFELAEQKAYQGLRRLAEQAGDEATVKLCEQNLADEVAMAMTLRNFRLRSDPGFRAGEESPFETPPELAELAPES